jgi:hypothetical protein
MSFYVKCDVFLRFDNNIFWKMGREKKTKGKLKKQIKFHKIWWRN